MELSKDDGGKAPVVRHAVYDSMYTQDDGLRIAGEILLLRRIDKERRVNERLQEQNSTHPFSADTRRKKVNND